MIKRTYKYRLKPTKAQQTLFEDWLYLCRWLYNYFLEQRKNAYEKDKTRITCYDQIKQIPKLKKQKPELKQIYSQVLQDVPRRLEKSFLNFFRRVLENKNGKTQKPGYPRFKGKNRYDSLIFPQSGFNLKSNKLNISKIGSIKIILHRQIQGNIKTLTIRRTNTNKWYACFSVQIDQELPIKPRIKSIKQENMIGIDMGLNNFLTTSQEQKIHNPRYLRESEQKLGKIQKKHSKKKLKSRNRNRSRLKIARLHEKINNQRTDFLHQLSKSFVNNFQFLAFEKLNIKGMVKNRYLSKSISDASWGKFLQMLVYKAEEAGIWAQEVNPRDTSQLCSNNDCERIVPKKTLSVRIHKCPFCKLVLDRDINAAKNILKLGLATAGTAESSASQSAGRNACGVGRLLPTTEAGSFMPSGIE